MNIETSPVAIIILILTSLVSFLAFGNKGRLMERMILNPYRAVHRGKWYLILTSTLIHADMMHLMFNMLTFYFFAFQLEATVGSMNFLLIYLGSAILSDITTVVKEKDNPDYNSLGASGAISGVLFSYILFYPKAKIALFFFPIGIPSPIFAVLYIAYCYYAAKKSQDYVNHDAHLWGAIAGLLLTALLIPGAISTFMREVF